MQCSFCNRRQPEVFPTSSGKKGCAECVINLFTCCRCGVCLEDGGGQWWDDGLAYCNKCAARVPRCSWCSRPAFEVASKDRIICTYCAHNFPHCDHCGELIHGHCTTYQDKVYCRKCGDRFPLCLECGTAIDGRPDCPKCSGPARACAGCETLFTGRWIVYQDMWYCLDCYWQACGRCRFCQEKKPPDGDTRCRECLSNRVQTLTVAQDLLDEVHWFCRDELGLTVKQPYKLKLADTAAAIPKLHTDAYMLSLSTVGLWVPKERTMWAVKGYPFWFTSAVLAHEHAHAWQQENCPPQSQDLLEGFAAWVEWRVVQNLGYHSFAENMYRLPCPIYGRGLRRCLQLEQQVGPQGLLHKVKTMRSFSKWTSFWAMIDEI